MKNFLFPATILTIFSLLMLFAFSCTQQNENKTMTKDELVAKGKYLVNAGGCNDCHSPKVYTDMGPVPDSTRLLSGYPQGETLPQFDPKMVQPGKWVMCEGNFAGWVGPWGISYAANLTPDNATGIGTLSEEMFVKTLREGKWMGVGRPLLPPMPWQGIGQMTDQDLKAIYAYLMSLPPIQNEVPQPVPPNKVGDMTMMK
ncbi:MAG: c-type cytochrome [Ignavibacteriaceae bacterium]|jgi:mono/diheme cytochrome c family protein